MEAILDTHAFLWYLLGDPNLGNKAKEVIDTKTGLYFSIASLWEISIKVNISKLQLNRPFQKYLFIRQVETCGYTNKARLRGLKDKRFLGAGFGISRDAVFDAYSIQRVWL